MVFGGIDYNQIYGQLQNFRLVNNKWWALKFSEFRYGDHIFDIGGPQRKTMRL
jgi:hypothetical protein